MKNPRPYTLALDLGTNSIGWAALALDEQGNPVGLLRSGVRLFSDSLNEKRNAPLNLHRRRQRSIRRMRGRQKARARSLVRALKAVGLLPQKECDRQDLKVLDPYKLRRDAVHERVPLHSLGRVFLQLNHRRGFKSNRKLQKDSDEGVVKEAIASTLVKMSEGSFKTYGEFLHHSREEAFREAKREGKGPRTSVRARPEENSLYPSRKMLEDEFRTLWEAQSKYYPDVLTECNKERIFGILFRQRPVSPGNVGWCTFEAGERRAPMALPRTQRFRIWQDLAHLAISSPQEPSGRKLTLEEKERLAAALDVAEKLSFVEIRSLLGLPARTKFNLEGVSRRYLKGNETGARLQALLGEAWATLGEDGQEAIVRRLIEEDDQDVLIRWLETRLPNSPQDVLLKVAQEGATLSSEYMHFSLKAILRIGPHLRSSSSLTEAIRAAGYQEKEMPRLDRLPYYGSLEALQTHIGEGTRKKSDPPEVQYGRIANPNVHVALNQVRRVVNAVIQEYGRPQRVIIEMVRELKMSLKKRNIRMREDASRQRKLEKVRAYLRARNLSETSHNILKYQLWEELPEDLKVCIYSGAQISEDVLFTNRIEVDHVIPYATSFDDSRNNKVLSTKVANNVKGKRTPFQAFSGSSVYKWEDIQTRLDILSGKTRKVKTSGQLSWSQRKRLFEDITDLDDFAARQLTDSAYIAKVAKKYLSHVCDPAHVMAVPGRITHLLRWKWNLNRLLGTEVKNRLDHRHHAIDAIVLGCITPSLLYQMRQAFRSDAHRSEVVVPLPWPTFIEDATSSVDRIMVSHKPDHGTTGQLFKETIYGVVDEENSILVSKTPLSGLTKPMLQDIVLPQHNPNSKSHRVKEIFEEEFHKEKDPKKAVPRAAARAYEETGVRRVKVLKKNKAHFFKQNGRAIRALISDSNYCLDIIKRGSKWGVRGFTLAEANQKGFSVKTPSDAVMRLRKGDSLELTKEGKTELHKVIGLDPGDSRVALLPLHLAKDPSGKKTRVAVNVLMTKFNARHVAIDEFGRKRYLSQAKKGKDHQ